MCCLLAILVILGPRFAIIVWGLAEPARWQLAFDTFVWPLLGFLFLPWTTLCYVAVAAGGIDGVDWVVIGVGFVLDVLSWAGGGYNNRNRMTAYTTRV